jgi:hypothetical protein
MRHARPITLLIAFGALPILANPVHYTIDFTGGSPTPTSGFFDYDPLGQVFTNFVVVIGEASFNMTSAANNPGIVATDPCNPGYTGAAATFGMLAGCAGDTATWNAILEKPPGQSVFNFEAGGAGGIAIDDYSVQGTVTSPTLSSGSFTITAASGAPCAYSINATSATLTASGGTASVSVLTSPPSNCPWTAVSNTSWLTILSGAAGTGAGTVSYSVAPDTGAGAQQRMGTLTIAGQTLTISQAPVNAHPLFFSGEVALSGGIYYLQVQGANFFGYYTYTYFPWLYHFDLGFEYFIDANDGAGDAYLYDAASGHWWFTSASFFP